jgi:clan AA aspartic protease
MQRGALKTLLKPGIIKNGDKMGIVKDEITITNIGDTTKAKSGFISAQDIRSVTVTAVADTGALRLTIPESLRVKLGLEIVKKVPATLADGEKLELGLSEGVEVRWKDRAEITQAWVVPKECSVLLGAIPMEGMDIMVDPKNQRLTGIHGDEQLGILY